MGAGDRAVTVLGGDDRGRIRLARDGDGQRGGAGTAFTVRDGIGDRAGCRLAGSQVLEGIAGVERVRTVGIQDERTAVGASRRRAHAGSGTIDLRDSQDVAIRVNVIDQDAVLSVDVERGVLVRGTSIVDSRGGRVGNVPVEILGGRSTGRVGRSHSDRVDTVVAALRSGMIDAASD